MLPASVVIISHAETSQHTEQGNGLPLLGCPGRSHKVAGADRCPWSCSVEFLLAAGPAEALRPLGAVASGGETARVMLALKAAPASVLATSGHSAEGKLLCGAWMLPSTQGHVQESIAQAKL